MTEREHGVVAGRDLSRDFGNMQVHRLGVAKGQDESRTLALAWAGGAKDIGQDCALIGGRRRPRAGSEPEGWGEGSQANSDPRTMSCISPGAATRSRVRARPRRSRPAAWPPAERVALRGVGKGARELRLQIVPLHWVRNRSSSTSRSRLLLDANRMCYARCEPFSPCGAEIPFAGERLTTVSQIPFVSLNI